MIMMKEKDAGLCGILFYSGYAPVLGAAVV